MRLLLIEDDENISDMIKVYLENEGYQVVQAYDGLEAVNTYKKQIFDLVLLDLMLPDIDGFDICKEISKKAYVIMLTARGEIIDKILGLELGADDYIVKPFEIKEVLVRIKVIFRRGEKGVEKETFNEDNEIIKVYSKDRRVIKAGEEIVLRRREFDLLNFLYENRGIVFSRDDLLEKIWGYDYEGDSRTVDVHIRRLREKLKEDKDSSLIETVFGIGYIMR